MRQRIGIRIIVGQLGCHYVTMRKDRKTRRWVVTAIVGGVTATLLALSTNVVSSLIPNQWARDHAIWLWGAVASGTIATIWLSIRAAHTSPSRATSARLYHCEKGLQVEGVTGNDNVGILANGPVYAGPVTISPLDPRPQWSDVPNLARVGGRLQRASHFVDRHELIHQRDEVTTADSGST